MFMPGKKTHPYPGSKDLILEPSLQWCLLLPRLISLSRKILLSVYLRFWSSAISLDMQTLAPLTHTPKAVLNFSLIADRVACTPQWRLFSSLGGRHKPTSPAAAAAVSQEQGASGHSIGRKQPGASGGRECGTPRAVITPCCSSQA